MKKRFTEEQIIGFLRETEAGLPVAAALPQTRLLGRQAPERPPPIRLRRLLPDRRKEMLPFRATEDVNCRESKQVVAEPNQLT